MFSNCQIRESTYSVKMTLLAISRSWYHCSKSLSLKFLLKESLRVAPSHTSPMHFVCSLQIVYTDQNYTASGEVPNQVSSQNLILAPLPTFHLYPNFRALVMDWIPFQNLEVLGLDQGVKTFVLFPIFFLSIMAFQGFPSPS